jgi:hypothetical protein
MRRRTRLGAVLLGGLLFAGSAGIASADRYDDDYFQILEASSLPLQMTTPDHLLSLANETCRLKQMGVKNWSIAAQFAIDGPYDSEQMKLIVSAAQDSVCLRP